ncbi:MAG: B12-binding domain-containing radical SAM protein [Desulfosarcina sp.]|nr:B12-binding domain-containing radical SAM protein [Desulfobacterales bacterium]
MAPPERLDILLVQPPIRDFYLTGKRTLPGGLISIAAVLRRDGFKVGLFDALARGKSRPLPLPANWDDLAAVYGPDDQSPFGLFNRFRHFGYSLPTLGQAARRAGAFLIGISSLFSPYEDMALAAAETVKSCCPDTTVVLGGHHATALPERILTHPSVDFILRGDGEASLPALARALVNQTPVVSVPGIGFRRSNGQYHIAPPVFVRDLDQLPPPAYDLVDASFYARKHRTSLVLSASRGCPLNCSYCCTGADSFIPYRRRSVNHVMQEIVRAADRMEIGFIDFEDENITLNRGWFLSLLDAIRRFFGPRPPELRAMNGLYPSTLDDAVIAGMQRAGFKTLNLSLGSTNPEQQKRFQRPDLRTAFDRSLNAAQKNRMTAVGYLIAGGPGQAPKTVIDDLHFLAARRVLAGLSIFYPAPGSRDFNLCHDRGLLPEDITRWRSTALPLGTAAGRLESATLLRLTRILNFMKYCLDEDGRLPAPAALSAGSTLSPADRHANGRLLLQGFLYDGKIRGIDKQGRIYVHHAADHLIRAFREGLAAIELKGVRRG